MSTAKQADRVSSVLGALKWTLVALGILYGVLAALGIEYGTGWDRVWELVALTAGVIAGMIAWCLLGWMQHTLGMLTILAQQGTLNVAPNLVVRSAGGATFGGGSGNGGIGSFAATGGVAHGTNASSNASGSAGTAAAAPRRPLTKYHDGDSPGVARGGDGVSPGQLAD